MPDFPTSQARLTGGPEEAPPEYMPARAELASWFLSGTGLEIGGLNWPLEVPPGVTVRQLDRMTTDELRREYPEMREIDLAEVDVVDDGETLSTIAEESQDFIVANHFLEHCADPIGTIQTHLGKLKPGGILFYGVPDKRYTFDFRRPPTSLEHMVRDHEEGPAGSRRQHFDEWTLFNGGEDADRIDKAAFAAFERRAEQEARRLEAEDYSIHTHVWTQAGFLELILHCRGLLGDAFDIEAAARRTMEFIVVLRKRGAFPPPSPPLPPERDPELQRLRADNQALGAELTGLRTSRSWRLTVPLRAAGAAARRLRRAARSRKR